MQVQWHGQSAFHLRAPDAAVFIDPFGDFSAALAGSEMKFDYPPIEGIQADLLLITHEHLDHNGVEAIGGEPAVLRSTAGTLESPVGGIVAISSEHDQVAGTQRGPNTIYCFSLDGLRVCHMGDFGQSELRAEQAEAIGEVDLLFIPVGDGPTIGGAAAKEIVDRLKPRWAVPMHYRTEKISFLEQADAFLDLFDEVERCAGPVFDTATLADPGHPVAVVPAVP